MKTERGGKMMVTDGKTSRALSFDSARMAIWFCSIVRSWKSSAGTVRAQIWLLGSTVIAFSMSFVDHQVGGKFLFLLPD